MFFTTRVQRRGILLHYDGDLLSNYEARIKRQSCDPSIGNFQYKFKYKEKRLWNVVKMVHFDKHILHVHIKFHSQNIKMIDTAKTKLIT